MIVNSEQKQLKNEIKLSQNLLINITLLKSKHWSESSFSYKNQCCDKYQKN